MEPAGSTSTLIRSTWSAPVRSNIPRAAATWMGASTLSTLLLSYLGRRAPAVVLAVLGPAQCTVLFLLSRLLPLLVCRDGSRPSLLPRGVVTDKRLVGVGVALGLLSVLVPVALSGLDLAVCGAVESLTTSAILILRPYLASHSAPLAVNGSLTTTLTALLPGIAITNATASFGYLLSALAVAGLTAASFSVIAQGVVEPRNAQTEAITFLYQVSPVAVLTSAAACSLALVLSLPLAHSFFPPPGFGIFIIIYALISTVALLFLVVTLHESTEPLRTAKLIVPRNLLIVAIAQLFENCGTRTSSVMCALAVMTLLQGWTSDEVSTISRDGDASPWRQRSNSGSPTVTRRSRSSISSPRTDTPTSPRQVPLPSSPRSPHPPNHTPRKPLPPLIAFLPILLLLLQSLLPLSYPTVNTASLLPPYIANRIGLHSHVSLPYTVPTLDIVFSYYNEDLITFSSYVSRVKRYGFVKKMKTRLVVYAKEVDEGVRRRRELENLPEVDEVVYLENVGREGGTYLTHIVREFGEEGEQTRIADLTLFLQHHLAWNWLAEPRFDYIDSGRSGFLALGPYLKSDCGKDLLGNGEFTRMRDIYSMFREEFCPPTLQLASYAAQFIVSRQRILANPRRKYERLLEMLNAPQEHWIHTEGSYFQYHGLTGPSNPFLGHALERSWTVIFGCLDPGIADRCKDDTYDKEACQCFD